MYACQICGSHGMHGRRPRTGANMASPSRRQRRYFRTSTRCWSMTQNIQLERIDSHFSGSAQSCEHSWSFTVIVKKRQSSGSSQPGRLRVVNGTSITEGGEHEEGV